ncbi:MAG: GntR family transcriptional regulator [Fibrobacteres bacterium]|nr:GntR family transcriptional regulator [Fibrobacterota bacterium]
MIQIGRTNSLKVARKSDIGFFLEGDNGNEIFLPGRSAPDGLQENENVTVFVYVGNEGKLLASTDVALAEVGDYAFLKVAQINDFGAFLEWGVPKQLLVPHREQKPPLKPGQICLVYIYLDDVSGRIVASTKINRWLKDEADETMKEGDEVDLLVCFQTDIGYKAIVNNSCWGVIYSNEVFKDIDKGDRLTGYIKKIREDGKIDLSLQKKGFGNLDDYSAELLNVLEDSGGFLPLHDNSAPEEIYEKLGVSKKTFKRAAGILYKKKLITFDNDGISLTESSAEKES